ncbi:MAG TPA: chloride channel protein [Candidatus Binatia bacterium]|nr:chloride channel protein [Candidatus Binatia bacterium]
MGPIGSGPSRDLRLFAAAVAIGALGALGAIVFREAIVGASFLFRGLAAPLGRPALPLALLAGGVTLLALDRAFPGEVLGYGFPAFLEMLHLRGARVKRRWVVVKTLASAISLGAGAAVGREGPSAQIGGTIGGSIAWSAGFPTPQRKTLIACGAAAAIATTFNAPIGGLMFAQEIVLLGESELANLSLIVIATVAAVVVSQGLLGYESVFHVTPFVLASPWECLTYAGLGAVLGVLAVVYVRFFHAAARALRQLPWPPAAVLLVGLATVGLLDVALPGNVSDGYPVINQALAGGLGWGAMAALAAAKIFASGLSLGCGAPGGVFGPILFIGAMAGGSFRALSARVLPGLTGPPGSYAVVGLAAFLGATTHAPLTAIFLLFEMTHDYSVALPALIATGVSLLVAIRLEPESIDTLGLSAEGKSLHPGQRDRLGIERMPIADVFRPTTEAIPEQALLPAVLRTIGESRRSTFPVVDPGGHLVGLLSMDALRTALAEEALRPLVVARDLCDPNVPTLTPRATLGEAARLLETESIEDVPVVDPLDRRRVLGVLSRADLIAAYNRAVASLGALPVSTWVATEPHRLAGDRVLDLEVPAAWVGRSLRELDCRTRYGITVLARRPAGGDMDAYEVPDPARPLAPGDVLTVAGPPDALERVRKGG